jgi:hypothetical protein
MAPFLPIEYRSPQKRPSKQKLTVVSGKKLRRSVATSVQKYYLCNCVFFLGGGRNPSPEFPKPNPVPDPFLANLNKKDFFYGIVCSDFLLKLGEFQGICTAVCNFTLI